MITIKPLVFNPFQVNTLVLYDETNEAIIVDPACSNEKEFLQISNFLRDNSLQLKYIVNTHCHVDHVAGVNRVKNEYNIPFLAHKNEKMILSSVVQQGALFGFVIDSVPEIDKEIKEGDELSFGDSKLTLFDVPGHSPGSIVLYSAPDKFMIAGDVLFNGSIGRTDLPGGNHNQLIDGIMQKLMTLPSSVMVYCGHGPTTTIGKEHDTNPFLK